MKTLSYFSKYIGLFLSISLLFHMPMGLSKDESSSLFLLNQTWKNKASKEMKLKDLKGFPAVITMIFTSCLGACPTMISNMKKFDAELNDSEKKKIRFYAFSMDPKRDSPEVLQKFYEKMSLDDRWELFTSNEEQARELSIALGFSYMQIDGGDFTHSSTLYLMSADGVILSKYDQGATWDDFLVKFREEIKQAPTKKK